MAVQALFFQNTCLWHISWRDIYDNCCVVRILLDGWETRELGQGLCRMTQISVCSTVVHGFTNQVVCHHWFTCLKCHIHGHNTHRPCYMHLITQDLKYMHLCPLWWNILKLQLLINDYEHLESGIHFTYGNFRKNLNTRGIFHSRECNCERIKYCCYSVSLIIFYILFSLFVQIVGNMQLQLADMCKELLSSVNNEVIEETIMCTLWLWPVDQVSITCCGSVSLSGVHTVTVVCGSGEYHMLWLCQPVWCAHCDCGLWIRWVSHAVALSACLVCTLWLWSVDQVSITCCGSVSRSGVHTVTVVCGSGEYHMLWLCQPVWCAHCDCGLWIRWVSHAVALSACLVCTLWSVDQVSITCCGSVSLSGVHTVTVVCGSGITCCGSVSLSGVHTVTVVCGSGVTCCGFVSLSGVHTVTVVCGSGEYHMLWLCQPVWCAHCDCGLWIRWVLNAVALSACLMCSLWL